MGLELSASTAVYESWRVLSQHSPRGLKYLHNVPRTQFWSLCRSRERQEGRERPDLRQSHARGRGADHARFRRQLDAQEFDLADDLRLGLLRDRDDVDGRGALRYRTLRSGGVPPVAPPERSDDHCRPRLQQDGAGNPTVVGTDARAQVGIVDGRLRDFRWSVPELRARP